MKNAFLIIAHNNYEQVLNMMRTLDSISNDFYIHINKKVQDFPREKFAMAMKESKVVFVNRHEIFWGGCGILIASLELLRTAFDEGDYSYFHLITGEDLPIKSKKEIDLFLKENLYRNNSKGLKTNYIGANINIEKKTRARVEQFNIGVKYWRDSNVFKREVNKKINRVFYFVQSILKVNRLSRLEKTLAYGSPWWSISDEFAKYVIENEEEMKTYFARKYMFGADEFAIQTYFFNSEYVSSVYVPTDSISVNLREIDFERGNGLGSPYTWHEKDFEQLSSSNNLFARKFNQEIDNEIISHILNWIQKGA